MAAQKAAIFVVYLHKFGNENPTSSGIKVPQVRE